MEAYIYDDPRIRELINQIIENIITACLLIKVDSAAKFQKGCQIVINLTSLLQEIPTLPSEFLADRVQQLLEQRERPMAVSYADAQAKSYALVLADTLAHVDAKFDANSNISQVFRPLQIPKQVNLLKCALKNIFPKGVVNWNKSLMGQTFLAQVEDILICLHNPVHPCDLKKYTKDGWKVFVCSTEDLTFPRRLERGIRQLQRSSTLPNQSNHISPRHFSIHKYTHSIHLADNPNQEKVH